MRHVLTTAALVLAAIAACRPADPDLRERRAEAEAGLGRCTQEEPGTPAKEGQTVFYVDRTPPRRTARSGATRPCSPA